MNLEVQGSEARDPARVGAGAALSEEVKERRTGDWRCMGEVDPLPQQGHHDADLMGDGGGRGTLRWNQW